MTVIHREGEVIAYGGFVEVEAAVVVVGMEPAHHAAELQPAVLPRQLLAEHEAPGANGEVVDESSISLRGKRESRKGKGEAEAGTVLVAVLEQCALVVVTLTEVETVATLHGDLIIY